MQRFLLIQYYLRFLFPLPWVILPLPRWLIGLFMCLDSFSTSIRFVNYSMVVFKDTVLLICWQEVLSLDEQMIHSLWVET